MTAPDSALRFADAEPALDMSLVANATENERYRMPDNEGQWAENLPVNVFDAEGELTPEKMTAIKLRFATLGTLQVINTGIRAAEQNDVPMNILEGLGFGEQEQFKWGGLTSGRTNLKYISKCMRETDDYPKHLFLLPHNEILYQRFMPERLLFFCSRTNGTGQGGRTFAHCAKKTEAYIAQFAVGRALLARMKQFGFTIETGFLDENHPEKSKNYFRSWQDRFGTHDRAEAMKVCAESTHQFDEGFWMEEPVTAADGSSVPTLMTRITIPAFKTDERDGETYMLFPRIALDGPRAHNGHRRFLIGDGAELTPEETVILLQAFMATREGRYYNEGDILLVDNIRYGHSRESYAGSRKIYASMAGMFWTDDVVVEINTDDAVVETK
ncbi:MAG: hypothetical protein JNM12_07890 [Alphaproteobacteria bacterium]|nr:hypothetical protein [Alphaproteobacteria bacterium]